MKSIYRIVTIWALVGLAASAVISACSSDNDPQVKAGTGGAAGIGGSSSHVDAGADDAGVDAGD